MKNLLLIVGPSILGIVISIGVAPEELQTVFKNIINILN